MPNSLRLDRLVPWMLAAGLGALLVPVLLTPLPPLTDYPNHLARFWLLTGPIPPELAAVYAVRWDALTNIGTDLVAAALGRALDVETAGRVVVGAAMVLPSLGGTLLYRVLHGRWHWWQLSFGLLAWSTAALDGFLNFEVGLGLAMLAACAEPTLMRRSWLAAMAGRAVLAGLLMVVHLFGLLFYAALICAFAVGPGPGPGPNRGRRWAAIASGVVVRAVPVALAVVVFSLLAPSLPGAEVKGGIGAVAEAFRNGFASLASDPVAKLKRSVVALRGYSNGVDILTAAALLLPPVAAGVARRLGVHLGMALVAAGLAACFVLVPFYIAGGSWMDTRFAHMAPFAAALAVWPNLRGRSAAAWAMILLCVSVLRTGTTTVAWLGSIADTQSLRRALAVVPPGAAVLPVEHHVSAFRTAPLGRYLSVGEGRFRHLVALAIPWRHAIAPNLFSARGIQPVMALPPWDRLVMPDGGGLLSVDALVHPERHGAMVRGTKYWAQWRADFDYILVVNADLPDDAGPFVPPPGITPVADEGFAQVYAIARPGHQRP